MKACCFQFNSVAKFAPASLSTVCNRAGTRAGIKVCHKVSKLLGFGMKHLPCFLSQRHVRLLNAHHQDARALKKDTLISPTHVMATMGSTFGGADTDTDQQAVALFRQLVPTLGGNYKGAHGKVAIVGGCLEFTGAPFFAAMSALRVGADMAYVICTPSAATAIKSYSPELMVLPYLPEQPLGSGVDPSMVSSADEATVSGAVARILSWTSRASAVVVGPGLGSNPGVVATVTVLMRETRKKMQPLVVDGSALTHIVAKDPETVQGYRLCILTPNVAELGRIGEAVGVQLPGKMSDAWLQFAPQVARAFHGPVVLAKGEVDLLCGPGGADEGGPGELQPLMRCTDPGSPRRCGGQGDVLAGTAATFLGWAFKHQQLHAQNLAAAEAAAPPPNASPAQPPQPTQSPEGITRAPGSNGLDEATVALCGFMACKVMRGAARQTFLIGERSMVAGDIIPLLYPTFKKVVGCL
ncbi:hypothetical protein VaNZ11_001097 [Volvox africanus]|uniref:ATP-dependent (S)-NAD(P)H-hydrate dehydratase n=1 Tax=Volvox africanus TaxID=51714 RepID=A0ABQ5RNV7_9CHLO|nr:hypothetical protein VaNZ11_001097 [Volvox africanus]